MAYHNPRAAGSAFLNFQRVGSWDVHEHGRYIAKHPRYQEAITGRDYLLVAEGDEAIKQYIAYLFYDGFRVNIPTIHLTLKDEFKLFVAYLHNTKGYTRISQRLRNDYNPAMEGDALGPTREYESWTLGKILAVALLINDFDALGGDDPDKSNLRFKTKVEGGRLLYKVDVGEALAPSSINPLYVGDITVSPKALSFHTDVDKINFINLHATIKDGFAATLGEMTPLKMESIFRQRINNTVVGDFRLLLGAISIRRLVRIRLNAMKRSHWPRGYV